MCREDWNTFLRIATFSSKLSGNILEELLFSKLQPFIAIGSVGRTLEDFLGNPKEDWKLIAKSYGGLSVWEILRRTAIYLENPKKDWKTPFRIVKFSSQFDANILDAFGTFLEIPRLTGKYLRNPLKDCKTFFCRYNIPYKECLGDPTEYCKTFKPNDLVNPYKDRKIH
ncbi:hypothetical protein FF38_08223 [Lucilia cuprina]|uniref:Uncharacterized protein n=1 Tax=Lucilia cuprina TaxID=7375 RepID=A0A0L0BYR5_LUCCU|nr:hypothetical protein FF38_08223 [Lucilia cuprina]